MANKEVTCNCNTVHGDIIQVAKKSMPTEETLYDLADFFKMFGDSTRLKILWALDNSELCVCDLAEVLNMTKSAVSHQLKTLRQEKLVKYRKEGKNVFYALDDDHVKNIIEIGLEHIKER